MAVTHRFFPLDHIGSEALRLLLTLWLTTALSAGGVAIVVILTWHQVPLLVLDESFLAQFTLGAAYFYAEQPAKTLAFEIGCAVLPFILALSSVAARSLVGRLKDSFLPSVLRLAVGVTWLLFLWCLSPLIDCPYPPLTGIPPSWLLSKWFFVQHVFLIWPRFLYLVLSCGFLVYLVRRGSSRGHRRQAFVALLFIWILLVPSDAYTRSQIDDEWRFTYHFNVVTHGLAQVIDGHHFLVHFPHIYGGYLEFLGPILSLFPHRIETLLLPFPILHGLAVLALLCTARLVIRDSAVLFVASLSLMALEFMLPSSDHYYPYAPIRTLFPALGLWVAALFFRRPTWFNYGAASCLAAMAPLWNLETGLVLWVSWSATLVARRLSERKPLEAFIELALQAGLLLASVMAFLLYLRIVSGLWPDPRALVTFQGLVVESGYMCLPMLVPDAWIVILMIYGIGLVAALHFFVKKTPPWEVHFILMISLMGVGLFSYFMGRSAESNLTSASYPAVLLAGVLLSGTRSLVLLNKLPRLAWALLFPLGLMVVWWALVFTLALPDLLAQSGNILSTWRDGTETPFQTNAAFVQRMTVPREKVFMLSNQSGFYYYLSDTVCPIDIPGPGELLRSEDMDKLIANLGAASFPKLFVDENFNTVSTYTSEIHRRIQEAISQHYRAAATSATGQVTLYVPR